MALKFSSDTYVLFCDKFVVFARIWYYSLLEHCTLTITNNSREVTFVVDVFSWTHGQYISQNQRRKTVMVSILFFVIKAACPDEEDKLQTIRNRPWRWSIFRAMRCRCFIFQQRCDTDYFWEKLYIAIVAIIFLDHRERLFFDYFAHFRTDYFAIIH